MKKLLFAVMFTVFAPTVLACSAISPESGFVHQFDKNQDGVLSKSEFKKIKRTNAYKVNFKLASIKAFKQLDHDKNHQLSAEELRDKVDYVRHPCADWEKQMRKMLEKEQRKHIDNPSQIQE